MAELRVATRVDLEPVEAPVVFFVPWLADGAGFLEVELPGFFVLLLVEDPAPVESVCPS